MDSKDSLFVERIKNHINLLEIYLEKIDNKFKPIESDNLTDKLIKTNDFFNNLNISSLPIPSSLPSSLPSSSSIPSSPNLKINDEDDDEEEEDYI